MQLAAKGLALTAADFYENPELVRQARAAFDEQRGEGFVYTPLIGDREPPLDYRRAP
jgi:aminobenzoyl-glutamate utilization protein B